MGTLQRGLAGLALGLFLLPALFVAYRAAGPAEMASLAAMAATVLPGYLANTLLLVAMATGLALVAGTAGAYAVAFFQFPGRRLLAAALVLPLTLPTYLVAMVYREMSHRHPWSPAVESPLGAAILFALALYPYVYLLAGAAFRHQAGAYLEAGRSLGVPSRAVHIRVLLPLASPAILLGGLLVALEVASDFGTASVLGIRTLTTAVHRAWFAMFDPVLAAQLAVLGALLPLLLVAAGALFMGGRGFANLTNRPRPARRSPLPAPWRWLVPGLVAVPAALGFAWPAGVLVSWAAEAFVSFRLEALYGDLLHTLGTAVGTTAAAVIIGLWLALLGRRTGKERWTLAPLAVLSVSYAMPAIALAIALLFLTGWIYGTTAGAWLADSAALIMVATTLRFTAFAYFGAHSGLLNVSPRIDEALRCLPRTRLQGLLRVVLPMIRGPLTVGALLVFLMTARELTLSLVLQPFGYGSLALSIYRFAAIDLYGPASLYALCLVLVLVYPVLSVHRWLGGGS